MKDETYAAIASILFFVVSVGLIVWLNVFAPCSLWGATPAKDTPSRCMGNK